MKLLFKIILLFFIYSWNNYLYSQPIQKFAVIGDYGRSSIKEYNVSQLVHSWNPDFIITVGDNNYEYGADSTIDSNIGKYYHDYIYPYTGVFGQGASVNKFFPSLGNHDWVSSGAMPYFNYFTLPGNERYYDYVKGNIHFFVIDSDPNEPDGTESNSVQGLWLHQKMLSSVSPFNIVYFHHPPYSSGQHGNNIYIQWPFKEWGASAVFCGHDHDYERIVFDGMNYFVNGLGGKDYRDFGTTVAGSIIRYTYNFGAQLVTDYNDSLSIKFIALGETVIDAATIFPLPIGIKNISNIVPVRSYLYQNYPNPFNPSTKITFDLSSRNDVLIAIYDITGKAIETLINNNMSAGKYETRWDASKFPSGIYFCRIITKPSDRTAQSDGYTETRKLILLK